MNVPPGSATIAGHTGQQRKTRGTAASSGLVISGSIVSGEAALAVSDTGFAASTVDSLV